MSALTRRTILRATAASAALVAPAALASPFVDAAGADPLLALGERHADIARRIQANGRHIEEALFDELDAVEAQIKATAPTTLPGALVKLRMVVRWIAVDHSDIDHNVDYDAMYEPELVTIDVLRDLERLTGGAA